MSWDETRLFLDHVLPQQSDTKVYAKQTKTSAVAQCAHQIEALIRWWCHICQEAFLGNFKHEKKGEAWYCKQPSSNGIKNRTTGEVPKARWEDDQSESRREKVQLERATQPKTTCMETLVWVISSGRSCWAAMTQKLLYTEHNKQKKRTEKFTLLSDHNESLLQRQPRAQYAELETMQCDDC